MMETIAVPPARQGQICRMLTSVNEKESIFLVTGELGLPGNDKEVEVVCLKDLQRNISYPERAARIRIFKNNLVVIAETLSDYIQSWNKG